MAAPAGRKPTIATTKTLAKQTSDATADSSPTNTIVRLHITPLSPSLLPTLLPRSLFAPSSSSPSSSLSPSYSYPPPVSYHTLEAFPEKNYGYVELPAQLAHKVTTRLNGTVFRGVKVSVQRAKPRTWVPPQKQLQHSTSEESGFDSAAEITFPQTPLRVKENLLLEANKRKKKEDGVYPGIQLPDNRWVKRAWTKITVTTGTGMGKQKDKKDKKSKKDEAKKGSLLFQTTLPPTIPLLAATDPKQIRKLEKKRKRAIAAAEAAAVAAESNSDVEPELKRKKKNKDPPEVKLPRDKVTIKEMARNQKFPGFLKTSQLDPNNQRGKVTEFVEGVGWVDTSGNVVDDSAVRKPTMKGHERLKIEKPVVSLEEETQQIEVKNHEVKDEALGSGSESESESEATERREERQGFVPKVHNNDDSEIISIGTTTKIRPKIKSSGSGGNIDTKESVVINHSSSNSPRSASSPSSSASDISASEILDTDTDMGSSSEDSSDSNREDSFDSNSEDDQEEEEEEEEEGPEKKKEDMKKEKPKLSIPQEILKTPSLKLAIPQPDMQKLHPLEALFKPNTITTNDIRPSSGGLFDFGVTDEEDNDEMKDGHFETPQKKPYRSAAPTPDTAVANKTIKWPDPSTVSMFEPTTPIAPQKLRFPQSQTAVSGDTDAPLLLQGHADSAFLRGLSIWSGGHLPEAKGVTERPPEEEEGQQDAQDITITRRSKRGNANEVVIGKHKERKIGQGTEVAKKAETRKEIWKERFFKYRGEWNREWKNKKREAGKLARRKKRERGIGNAK